MSGECADGTVSGELADRMTKYGIDPNAIDWIDPFDDDMDEDTKSECS